MINSESDVRKPLLSGRIASIDVFRGLTILSMIFVNDLGRVKGVPWWLKHFPADASGMTFVDVVFPAFLFIVGMAIPFALGRRMERGDSALQIWRHIVIRTLGLLVIGVFMVNMYTFNTSAAAIGRSLWVFLMFLSIILVWNQYPKAEGSKQYMFIALRLVGVIGLIIMAILYRGGSAENVIWMRTSWWGILGLIGWAYITSCAAYLLFRKQIAGMMGVLALLIALYIGNESGALKFLDFINKYVWLAGHIGGHASITVAGVILGMLFLDYSPARTPGKRIAWMLLFALGMFVAGYLLQPLYGINKVKATPTWCLYCSAICCVVYAFLYWLMDLKNLTRWSNFVKPAGANPLLAYILPDIVYALFAILGITFLNTHLNSGFVGIIRSFVFCLVMVALAGLFYRWRVRLRL
jgi:heparan-alpha-glucosaminide N-acetyltransferase